MKDYTISYLTESRKSKREGRCDEECLGHRLVDASWLVWRVKEGHKSRKEFRQPVQAEKGHISATASIRMQPEGPRTLSKFPPSGSVRY